MSRLWDAGEGRFDGALLRRYIVLRGWGSVGDFAAENGLREGTVYRAVEGKPVRDRTALKILQSLAKRQPIQLPVAS